MLGIKFSSISSQEWYFPFSTSGPSTFSSLGGYNSRSYFIFSKFFAMNFSKISWYFLFFLRLIYLSICLQPFYFKIFMYPCFLVVVNCNLISCVYFQHHYLGHPIIYFCFDSLCFCCTAKSDKLATNLYIFNHYVPNVNVHFVLICKTGRLFKSKDFKLFPVTNPKSSSLHRNFK